MLFITWHLNIISGIPATQKGLMEKSEPFTERKLRVSVLLVWYSLGYFAQKSGLWDTCWGYKNNSSLMRWGRGLKIAGTPGLNRHATFLFCSLRMLFKSGTFLTRLASLHICLFPFSVLFHPPSHGLRTLCTGCGQMMLWGIFCHCLEIHLSYPNTVTQLPVY